MLLHHEHLCITPLHLLFVLCIQRIQHIIDVLKAFELQLWPATTHVKTALRKEFHSAMDGNRILNRGLSPHSCGPSPLMQPLKGSRRRVDIVEAHPASFKN